MEERPLFDRPIKDILIAVMPAALLTAVVLAVAYKFVDPAPPHHLVISTSVSEGDYLTYAKLYRDILKEAGVTLEVRTSSGGMENYSLLKDEKSDVEVGFVHDGIGNSEEAPDLVSLGSLYYEPIWVFYRGAATINRFSSLINKKVAVGSEGGGARALALSILSSNGVNFKNASLLALSGPEAAAALRAGTLDAAMFLATPDDAMIKDLVKDPKLKLMSLDQAEAITRQIPFLHHLVLPHGSIDLHANLPAVDVDLVAPTATLLMKDSVHPALAYLLLKAMDQVHSDPGIFEKKDEFPNGKDYLFALSDEAKSYYKSGSPFWQRYLPFWLATLVDRFILLVIPVFGLLLPIVKMVPRLYSWRLRSRFYHRYGELKFLETQVKSERSPEKYHEYLVKLDGIEDRVNHMKVPLDFSDHIYGLREHIDFVRARLRRAIEAHQALDQG